MLTSQVMPKRSTNIPNSSPHGAGSSGWRTWPPSDSAANQPHSSSASSGPPDRLTETLTRFCYSVNGGRRHMAMGPWHTVSLGGTIPVASAPAQAAHPRQGPQRVRPTRPSR